MEKAIFIDRDGTLIKDVPYNSNLELIELEMHAVEFLQLLKQKNFLLIIVSNQSGIAKGYFKEEDVCQMHNHIQRLLLPYNVQIDGFFYCPHSIDGVVKDYAINCDCRKPKAGMLYNATQMFGISLYNSWMVGDILNDVEAGKQAGCKTVLIDNGNETEWLISELRIPDYWAADLKEASEIILSNELAIL